MISFSHAYKMYSGPSYALKDINLDIDKGEFVLVSGPSGAGKTTLFRLISAYEKPSSGRVIVSGYDIGKITSAKVPLLRRQIGVVFQDFRLLKDRTVFENVALPLQILGERSNHVQRRVQEVLDTVGLRFKTDQYPDQLSGGEQQRVAIARAIVHKPGILIADEPTGNLDQDLALEIIRVIENVNAQGTTVFVATHDKSIVNSLGRRTVHIRAGELLNTPTASYPTTPTPIKPIDSPFIFENRR